MKYEQYEKRMIRLNKFLNGLYRFKFLILGVVTLTLIGTVTMLSVKGTVYDNDGFKTSYYYGDDISYKASALLNSAYVEYAKEGQDKWTEAVPYAVGSYRMRAYSYNGWGQKTFGKTHNFSILPIEASVWVTSESVNYGDKPLIGYSLLGTDKIDPSYKVIYDELYPESGDTNVCVDISSIKIYDRENKDKTSCYNLTAVKSGITITNRPLTIQLNNVSKMYDGVDLIVNGGSFVNGTSLCEGDTIEYLSSLTISVPSSAAYNSLVKISHGEKDVTHMYDITINQGSGEITKIPVKVSSDDVTRQYNGKTIAENKDITFNYELGKTVMGHHIVFESDSSINNIKDVTSGIEVNFTWKMLDASNNDVTDLYYYEAEKNIGKINITKRDLKITSGSVEKTYDGKSCSNNDFTYEGLAEGDTIKLKTTSTIDGTYVGSFYNVQTYSIVRNEGGTEVNVESNYNAVYKNGVLTIKKQKITAYMPYFGSAVYDGSYHNFDASIFSVDDFPNKEEFSFSVYDVPEAVRNVGTYNCDQAKLKIELGFTDVTHCFEIEYVYRTSLITPRDISIDVQGYNKVYDGSDYNISFEIGGSGLASNDHIECNTALRKAGTTLYTSVQDAGIDIIQNGTSSSSLSNYAVTFSADPIVISKRDITITYNSDSKTYDGGDVDIASTSITSGSLANGDSVNSIPDSLKVSDAGTYNIATYGGNVTITNGSEDVTSCYNITVIKPDTNIQKRHIKVIYKSVSKTYDGTEITLDAPTVSNQYSSLCAGHSIKWIPAAIKNAGTYGKDQVAPGCFSGGKPIILDSSSNNVSDNYDIDFEFTDSVISPRDIGINIDKQDCVYDGETHPLTGYTVTSGSFANNEVGTLANYTTMLHAGTYRNDSARLVIKNATTQEDVTSNYNISVNYGGTSTVSKRSLDVYVSDISLTYNGYKFFDDSSMDINSFISYNSADLKQGTYLKLARLSNPLFGTYSMSELLSISLANDNIENPENDYNFVVHYGTLTYTKRTVVITTTQYKASYGSNNIEEGSCLPIIDSTDQSKQLASTDRMSYTGNVFVSGYKVGEHNVSYETDKFIFKNTKYSNMEVTSCYNIVYSGLENKVRISAVAMNIEFNALTKPYDGYAANEQFTFNDEVLGEGDSLYILCNNVKEKVENSKVAYDMIVDMVDAGSYKAKVYSGETTKLLYKGMFRIYKSINDTLDDVTSCYVLDYKPGMVQITA